MSQEMKQGHRGRPHRKSAPFVIRGTVPDGHPLYEQLRVLGSARAAMFLLELATNRLDGFVAPNQNEKPSSSLHAPVSQNAANLLSLKTSPSSGNLTQPGSTEVLPLDSVSDLLNFTGG